MKVLLVFVSLFAMIAISSCGGSSKIVDRMGVACNKVPYWVKKLPKAKNMIYAVGFAMPDTFPERSLSAAKMSARLELSRTIETKIDVDTQMVDVFVKKLGVEGDNKARTTVIRNLIKEKATKMVKNSKVEQVFYDNCNLNQRGEGAHYVLASVPR